MFYRNHNQKLIRLNIILGKTLDKTFTTVRIQKILRVYKFYLSQQIAH